MQEQDPTASRWERASHWLENVFWYHYKWYYFLGLFAAVLLISSVVSFVTRVHYDWTVPYVHLGAEDRASAAAVKKALAAVAVDVSGNGKVQILVEEYPETGDPGRRDLLGLLRDPGNILFVVDGETLALYRSLGYFDDAASLGGGLWAVRHDEPVKPFTLEEFAQYGYTQEQIDLSNQEIAEEHAQLVEAAGDILQSLRR